MNGRILAYSLLLVVSLVALTGSLYVVRETERAVVLRFGALIDVDSEPGLHVKIPFVDEVRKFDARVLTLDAPAESFYTLEKKRLIVNSFSKWRQKSSANVSIRLGTSATCHSAFPSISIVKA